MNKYILSLSVVLNAILIMAVVGVLPFLLFVLLLCCAALIGYIRHLLGQMNAVKDDIAVVKGIVRSFGDHTESIHDLEMYYGDETLQGLVRHSKGVTNDLEYILGKYSLEEELDGEEEEE